MVKMSAPKTLEDHIIFRLNKESHITKTFGEHRIIVKILALL